VHGAADLVGGLEPQEVGTLLRRSDMTVTDVRTFTNVFVSMNIEGPGKTFFSDVKVRLALTQAIDRQKIIDEVIAVTDDDAFAGCRRLARGRGRPPPRGPRRGGTRSCRQGLRPLTT